MIKFKKQLVSVLGVGAIFASMVAPAFADTTLLVSGNGASSNSTVNLSNTSNTTVVQNNNATITNNVTSNASTGSNNANQNTGGSVGVMTGNATTNTTVSNMVNSNTANVTGCCNGGNTTVNISGNGALSTNNVTLNQSADNSIFQDNNAKVTNNVTSNATTGKNNANQNTGGSVTVSTGNASTTTNVSTTANSNSASIGGGNRGGGSLSAVISGNGAFSRNNISLDVANENTIVQNNVADIRNTVKSSADTGYNNANQNTGGSVFLLTGNASTDVSVDNNVNFNSADVLCGCLLDTFAKISGNGFNSLNRIMADLGGSTSIFQGSREGGNLARLTNDVRSNQSTGKNDTNQNTGPVVGDPTVVSTGDASAMTSISNGGNVNVVGPSAPGFTLPFSNGLNLNVTLDLGALLSFLHLV